MSEIKPVGHVLITGHGVWFQLGADNPHPDATWNGRPAWQPLHYADALRQARDDALDEAAKVCDSVNNYDNPMTAGDCADAIRALKEKTCEF